MTNGQTELPNNHVVAVINGSSAAQAATEELRTNGFPETTVMEGEEAALKLDPKGENASLLGKVFKAVQDHLSEEPNYLTQYQEEARQGNSVVAVEVKERDQAEAVSEILQRHGARNVRFFGKLAVADLSLETNPTARSADSPERQSGV
jgi:hypothetical protein